MEKFKFFVTDDIIKEIVSHDEGKRKLKNTLTDRCREYQTKDGVEGVGECIT